MNKSSSGFNLISLAITLVIMGLLIGSIFTASSMTRTARLQSVLTDVDKFKAAFLAFKDKYHSLPGDMPDAESFWGTDAGGCPGAFSATPHITTCNGDGDGRISGQEMFRAWQQLADAGLVTGAYSGMSGLAGFAYSRVGINVPASRLTPAGYTLYYAGPNDSAGINLFPGDYGHIIFFGNEVVNNPTTDPILIPAEAYLLDSKIDDGMPGYGNVTTSTSVLASNANCITTNVASTSRYNTAFPTAGCNLIFVSGF